MADGHGKALTEAVERGVLDAVVGRQAADQQVVDGALAQQLCKIRAVEGRVTLGATIGSLVEHDVDVLALERRMQLGAGRARHAVHRPRPGRVRADERAVIGRMPVARGDDERELARRCQLVEARGDVLSTRDRQRAVGRGEVVLIVDDDQRAAHASSLFSSASSVCAARSS